MFIARAMCGLTHVTAAALCSSCSLLCISKCDWAPENDAGRSVSVNGNEESRWRDLSPIQFSCNCNYSLITHNKTPVHSTWRLLRVRPARPPVLTWVPSSVPPGNNNQDAFPTGSRRIKHYKQKSKKITRINFALDKTACTEWKVYIHIEGMKEDHRLKNNSFLTTFHRHSRSSNIHCNTTWRRPRTNIAIKMLNTISQVGGFRSYTSLS